MPVQTKVTLTQQQLNAVLENNRHKTKKWTELCRELNITPNKLYGNLIFLGLRCAKQRSSRQYFDWEQAKMIDPLTTSNN